MCDSDHQSNFSDWSQGGHAGHHPLHHHGARVRPQSPWDEIIQAALSASAVGTDWWRMC